MASLSPAALDRARKSFYAFAALNSAAFVLLSGSFTTLYALRLGASNAFVGFLNALGYITFFFLPLGRALVRGRPIVKVFGRAWLARFLGMLPALAAPALAAAGAKGAALGLILASVALFNLFRGIGLIGNNPLVAYLASGGTEGRRDKGSFMVNVLIVGSLGGLGTNLAISLLLGRSASSWVYALAMGAGIAIGVASCLFLLRAPEPEGYRPPAEGGLWTGSREALSEKPLRDFFATLLALSFIAGMARSFLPVYAKEVFGQGDDAVMAFSLIGSLGSLAMGLLTRLLVDRLGAKPLYVIYTAVAALSLAPLALAQGTAGALAGPAAAAAFLVGVNFVSAFGFGGEENAAQIYFFALARPERTLDLGVLYFLVFGLGGSLGSGAGGLALDALAAAGLSNGAAYRVFYGALAAALALAMITMGSLRRLGSASVRESLGVMLSLRDLRSFDLLARLDRSVDPVEETRLIAEIGARSAGRTGGAASRAQRELLGYLASPRFDVRIEALLAIEKMPALERGTEDALMEEVRRQPFTTAYLAARILGKVGCARSAPVLREAAATQDYMLQGSAVIALARLRQSARRAAEGGAAGGEKAARETARADALLAETLLAGSPNPRVLISAAYAIELMGSRDSVPALVTCMRRENPPPFVCDELVLSTASVLALMPRFYAMYEAFLESEEGGLARLRDAADEVAGAGRAGGADFASAFREALDALFEEPAKGAPMARLVMMGGDPGADIVIAEAALDPGLAYRGFRFLVAAHAVLGRALRQARGGEPA